ncbi:MAG TPA: 30S ribosomal protein S20 [Sphaerochaeta sp.]|nr:MAG: 30S ribosomal protein S20 [Spirochaetes bacterium GWC2_52_13]OHD62625.1 MAG: 30S ribosomal protein S20 [Spirochaetes bacterium GWF2_52_7]PKL22662.1 MAG: 30S ribosomal protein S20 [Spirochaetae bacterium HGW-Spirochaetae-4]HCG63111.1 30S ribosomal protein S20 [Sphaerochaeta sp.]HCJ94330.1 30S ribosomal protein S20 [Sphaerochaeta sp.]
MFNTSSAAKRERQNEKRRLRNRETKSAVRTAVKKFQIAAQAKDNDLVKEKYDLAIKLIDTAGSKGVYHANTVSRKKSRLHAQYNALQKAE